MTQSNALADALLKNPLSIGGLLSQLSDALGSNSAQGGMFSNLLSKSGLDSSLVTSTQTSMAPSNGFTPSTAMAMSADTSNGSMLQNLTNLSSTLHQVLDVLRQKIHDNAVAGSGSTEGTPATGTPVSQTSSQTADTSSTASNSAAPSTPSAAPTGTPVTTTTAANATPTSDASAATVSPANATTPATGTQKLADIIAELLMLTQMMVQNLQGALPAAGANAAQMAANGDTSNANSLTLAAANGAGTATSAADTPLMQLMAALQSTVKQLMPNTDTPATLVDPLAVTAKKADAQALADLWTSTATTSAAATATSTLSLATVAVPLDITKQLAALDKSLKNVLSALEQAPVTATQDTTAIGTSAAPAADAAATSNLSGKQVAAETWQAQISNVAANTTAPAVPMTSAQAIAAGAPFVAASSNSAGANLGSNSDALADNGRPASGNTGANANANAPINVSAEGAQATGTYNFASQLSAFRAANGGATGLPSAVDQVILQMNRSVKNGNDQMSLQLSPGDLGKITVKLDFGADGKVQGTVVADNPKTLDMLQKDQRSLERALQDAGLRADPGSLQFSLGGQSNQNNSGQSAANGKANGSGDGTVSADASSDTSALVDLGSAAETYYLTPSGVNIRV
jgi:hypothetical protein